MQKYINDIIGTSGSTLSPITGATCSVYLTGTSTLATLYSDNGVTPKANPISSSSTGRIEFYAADARYDISVVKSGYTTVTLADILLEDLADATPGAFTTLSASGNLNVSQAGSDVINPAASTTQIRISASGFAGLRVGVDNSFNIDTYNSASPINVLKITQAGAATFNYGLAVTGTLSASGALTSSSGSFGTGASNVTVNASGVYNGSVSSSSIYVVSDGGSSSGIQAYGSTHATKASILELRAGAAVRGTFDASGNLGIGTSSPNGKLNVYGNFSQFNNGSYTGYLGSGSTLISGAGATDFAIRSDAAMVFATAGATERARIDSSGNLLVGTTNYSPTAGVGNKISADATAPYYATVGSSSSSGNAAYTLYSTGAAAYRFYVDYGGTIHATAIVITAISDQRLKENVRDIETGLDSIMALKPRRFDWKGGKGQDKKDVAGFIAQEFENVFPECVGTSKAGEDGIEYKNINHETLIPTLVKAIQEQQAIITALTTRITALEAK